MQRINAFTPKEILDLQKDTEGKNIFCLFEVNLKALALVMQIDCLHLIFFNKKLHKININLSKTVALQRNKSVQPNLPLLSDFQTHNARRRHLVPPGSDKRGGRESVLPAIFQKARAERVAQSAESGEPRDLEVGRGKVRHNDRKRDGSRQPALRLPDGHGRVHQAGSPGV